MTAVDEILAALPVEQVAQQTGSSPDEVRTTAAAVLPALLGGLEANAADPSGAGSLLEALGQHDDDLLTGGADLSQIDEGDGRVIANHIFGEQEDEVVTRLGGLPGVGGSGFGGALVKKLIPILAPMVLSWLADKVLRGRGSAAGGGSAGGGSAGGGLGDVLGGVLGGGASAPSGGSGGAGGSASLPGGGASGQPGSLDDLLRDVLGGATGGGSASGAGRSGGSSGGASGGASGGGFDPGSIIGDVLGGILGGGRR